MAPPRQHCDTSAGFRSCWCARLLQGPENRAEPAVARLAQELDLPFVGPFDRLYQRPLLLGIELRPVGELLPPALEARQEVLREAADAALPGRQVVGEVGAGGSPADRGTQRHGAVELVHADYATQDEVDAFAPHRSRDAAHDITGYRLLEDDGKAAKRAQVLHRAIHAGG